MLGAEGNDLYQLNIYGFHAEAVSPKVGELVESKSNDVVVSRIYHLLLCQISVSQVVVVEKHVLLVSVANHEAVVVIFIVKL